MTSRAQMGWHQETAKAATAAYLRPECVRLSSSGIGSKQFVNAPSLDRPPPSS